VLAARAARAVGVDADVVVGDLDVARVLDDRRDLDGFVRSWLESNAKSRA